MYTHTHTHTHAQEPLEADGMTLPAVDLSIEQLKTSQSTDKESASRRGGKKMGARRYVTEEEKQEAADRGARGVEKFLAFFASNQGKKLKAKLKQTNKWFNCDAPYLGALITGKIPDLSRHLDSAWQAVRAVAVGGDYASRTYSTLSDSGAFSMVVQADSSAMIEIDLGSYNQDVAKGDRRAPILQVGPFRTAMVGEVTNLGVLKGEWVVKGDESR